MHTTAVADWRRGGFCANDQAHICAIYTARYPHTYMFHMLRIVNNVRHGKYTNTNSGAVHRTWRTDHESAVRHPSMATVANDINWIARWHSNAYIYLHMYVCEDCVRSVWQQDTCGEHTRTHAHNGTAIYISTAYAADGARDDNCDIERTVCHKWVSGRILKLYMIPCVYLRIYTEHEKRVNASLRDQRRNLYYIAHMFAHKIIQYELSTIDHPNRNLYVCSSGVYLEYKLENY